MRITVALGTATICLSIAAGAYGQTGPSDLRIFGFFQPQFVYQNGPSGDPSYTSFSLQQLNIFFQKDLGTGLSSFVNIEAVNSFSTRDGWGSMRIEEAWVRYRTSRAFNLKAGLQIPIFNNFNEIKNRMPLIPYVIRPLVYESSLSQTLNNPLYIPQQAFVQAFGWAPLGSWKFDYAGYLGNTDMVVSSFSDLDSDGTTDSGIATGIDTSAAVLFGSRIGVRKGSFKLGLSNTMDRTSLFAGVNELPGAPTDTDFGSIRRFRSGFDLSFQIGQVWIEHESTAVFTTTSDSTIDAEVGFTYTTVGYDFSERVQTYASYQIINQRIKVLGDIQEVDIWMPTVGIAYRLEDLITLKAQYAFVVVDVHNNPAETPDPKFHYLTAAVSVSF